MASPQDDGWSELVIGRSYVDPRMLIKVLDEIAPGKDKYTVQVLYIRRDSQ